MLTILYIEKLYKSGRYTPCIAKSWLNRTLLNKRRNYPNWHFVGGVAVLTFCYLIPELGSFKNDFFIILAQRHAGIELGNFISIQQNWHILRINFLH